MIHSQSWWSSEWLIVEVALVEPLNVKPYQQRIFFFLKCTSLLKSLNRNYLLCQVAVFEQSFSNLLQPRISKCTDLFNTVNSIQRFIPAIILIFSLGLWDITVLSSLHCILMVFTIDISWPSNCHIFYVGAPQTHWHRLLWGITQKRATSLINGNHIC